MSDAACFTLRHLPLPAKLVLSTFLIAVGLGYFSALVQLHLQHSSRNGEHLPTPDDVIERFSGVKKHDPNAEPAKGKIEQIISGPKDGGFDKNNMAPAFFAKSGKGYEKDCADRGKAVVDAERDGERKAMTAWILTKAEDRKAAYDSDKFPLPEALAGQPISDEFYSAATRTVAVKSLIESRCVKCHNGDKKPDLDDLAKFEPLLNRPPAEVLPGGWVRSGKQMSVEGLTQSTHAHLLSFATLFMLTGLIYAFTSYPTIVRIVFAPIVLVAQIADISCWWLARLDGLGPNFALAIIGTGTIVGVGLTVQILGSLFNMYGGRGKLIVGVLLLLGAGGFGILYGKVIQPALAAEKAKA